MKKIRRLITHGCSFTYGEELQDPNTGSWPALVADQLGVELVNLGQPAYSNDAILQDIVAQDINNIPAGHQPSWENYTDLVIICWTTYLRMQYQDQAGWFTIWPGREYKKNILKWNKYDDLREGLTKHTAYLHNDDWLYSRWLTQIILMQSYLESKHVKYLFFSAFDNQQQFDNKKQRHRELLGKINHNNFIGWPNEGFSEWAYPCELGPRKHPLEDGHRKVADKLLDALADRYDIR